MMPFLLNFCIFLHTAIDCYGYKIEQAFKKLAMSSTTRLFNTLQFSLQQKPEYLDTEINCKSCEAINLFSCFVGEFVVDGSVLKKQKVCNLLERLMISKNYKYLNM